MSLRVQIRKALRPRIWWWLAAAMVLHLSAWVAWFAIAARHSVADVPLAVSTAR